MTCSCYTSSATVRFAEMFSLATFACAIFAVTIIEAAIVVIASIRAEPRYPGSAPGLRESFHTYRGEMKPFLVRDFRISATHSYSSDLSMPHSLI